MASRLPPQPQSFAQKLGFESEWPLILAGGAIGVVTAFGAIAFADVLHWCVDTATELPSVAPWWTLLLLPSFGGLLTGFLVWMLAREARGHGVPEVIAALYRRGGRIRPRVALVKPLTSVCTIGSGGSAGAEGPIVQIGSAIGSGIAQSLRIPRDQVGTLLGCGAAAGIASVFNAPIAGVFFVMEILLRDFSLKTFTPIVVSSVLSMAVTQAVLGNEGAIFAPAGELSHQYTFSVSELPFYAILGVLCGAVACGFVRLLFLSEDFTDKVRLHPVLKPVAGGLLLGVLGLGYALASDDRSVPPFFANGYETIRALLQTESYSGVRLGLGFLAALLLCKAVATCLTLGSGGSGGVFAPSLFLGATAGGAVGLAVERIGLLPEGGSPASYALAGMAAVVSGTTHAPLTAILIVLEITGDIYVLAPIMLSSVVATIVAQLMLRDSVYTLKLRRRGVLTGSSRDLTLLRKLHAAQAGYAPYRSVPLDAPVSQLVALHKDDAAHSDSPDVVVTCADGRYQGMLTAQDLRTALLEHEAIPLLLVSELTRRDLPALDPDETLDSVFDKFSQHDVASLPVLGSDGRVRGLLTRNLLLQRYQRALRED